MSILRKFIVLHDFIDNPEFQREAIPYHMNLLNATEEASGVKINQGELEELSDKQWNFIYTKGGRKQKLTVLMTDEFMQFGGVKSGSGFPPPKRPPKFK